MQSHWLNKRLVGAATKIQFLISKLVFTCQLHLIGLLTVRNRCYVWETSWRTPQKLASFFSILRSKTTGGIAKFLVLVRDSRETIIWRQDLFVL